MQTLDADVYPSWDPNTSSLLCVDWIHGKSTKQT